MKTSNYLFNRSWKDLVFPSTTGGGRGGENRGFHRVGEGESSASTRTDSYNSFVTPFTTKRTITEIWGLKTYVEIPSKSATFLHVKPNDFKFVAWFMSILKFGLPQLSFEVF